MRTKNILATGLGRTAAISWLVASCCGVGSLAFIVLHYHVLVLRTVVVALIYLQ